MKAALLACLVASFPAVAAAQEEIPHLPDAVAQLQAAREAHAAIAGSHGAERLARQEAAVAAYRAVRAYFPRARGEIAEAAFRRGELLRAMEEVGAARGAFQEVLEFAPAESDWRVRALLELGHASRREGKYQAALVDYRRARDCRGASLRYRNDGREWITRVLLLLGEWEQAEREAQAWLAQAEDHVEEIEATDRWMEAMIGGHHYLRASRTLEALRQRLAEAATRPTTEGAAIANALEGLRTPRLLREAKRNGRAAEGAPPRRNVP